MSKLAFSQHTAAYAAGRHLRVVNYHNTPESSRETLRTELQHYAKQYRPLSLADVDAFFATGSWPGGGPGMLAVFYEGYRNSATVAAEVCDELGITGWFPVCTAFVDCPVEEQELFARSHDIGLVQEELDGRRLAMSWDEIASLSQRHVVTPHTASHSGVEQVGTDEQLYREVVEPKQKMDAVTGQSAPAMAWLHGSPYGVSPRHDAAVREAGYRYLISNTMLHRL